MKFFVSFFKKNQQAKNADAICIVLLRATEKGFIWSDEHALLDKLRDEAVNARESLGQTDLSRPTQQELLLHLKEMEK